MPLIHRYTLVCDEVRREDNGKGLIIGLYTPGITLARFPTKLPKLTFFNYFEVTSTGTWEITFRLSHAETGALVGPEGQMKIEVGQVAGPLVLPVVIGNPQFQIV